MVHKSSLIELTEKELKNNGYSVVVVYVLIFALLLASGVGIVIFLGLIATGGLVLA